MPEAKDWKAVVVPGVLSLFVTLLRLVGELQGWNPVLFNKSAGGGGALLGITWLVIPFGAWFGWQVAREGSRPGSFPRAFGLAFLAFALLPASGALLGKVFADGSVALLLSFCLVSIPGFEIARRAWPELGRRLFAYALAARVPVALLMLPAMLGNWGTHYDVSPPGFPGMAPLAKWLAIGLLPQMTVWLWFTLAVGTLAAVPVAAIAGRRR